MTYSSSENKMRKNISEINFSLHSILTDDSLHKFLVWTAFQASAFVQTGVKWTIQHWQKNGTADKRRGSERKIPRKLLQNCLMQRAERKTYWNFREQKFCFRKSKVKSTRTIGFKKYKTVWIKKSGSSESRWAKKCLTNFIFMRQLCWHIPAQFFFNVFFRKVLYYY